MQEKVCIFQEQVICYLFCFNWDLLGMCSKLRRDNNISSLNLKNRVHTNANSLTKCAILGSKQKYAYEHVSSFHSLMLRLYELGLFLVLVKYWFKKQNFILLAQNWHLIAIYSRYTQQLGN